MTVAPTPQRLQEYSTSDDETGPSGCGKSTLLRCFNRMNDLVGDVTIGGTLRYHGDDLHGSNVDPIVVRRRVGMVFQKPNPFPQSIRDNVAYGLRARFSRSEIDDRVEVALQQAARVSDVTAFMTAEAEQDGRRVGRLVEINATTAIFTAPADARTEGYITGRFG